MKETALFIFNGIHEPEGTLRAHTRLHTTACACPLLAHLIVPHPDPESRRLAHFFRLLVRLFLFALSPIQTKTAKTNRRKDPGGAPRPQMGLRRRLSCHRWYRRRLSLPPLPPRISPCRRLLPRPTRMLLGTTRTGAPCAWDRSLTWAGG